jgi:RimJ/RimL family protein N-acetyltransferase
MTFEFQPTLEDSELVLRPLRADDFDALFAVASDPELWAQHPARNRYRHDVFVEFFEAAMRSGGAFAIIEKKTDKIIGSSRYYDLRVDAGEIEIGWTFISRLHWGSGTNAAVKKLMLSHAFKFVDTVIFLVGSTNLRSRRAVEKLGAVVRDENAIHDGAAHVVYALKRPHDEY